MDSSQLDTTCIESLGHLIQQNNLLKCLGLIGNKSSKNGIDDSFVDMLAPFIIGNQNLKELDLRYNSDITDKSMPCLQELATKSCLNEISMFYTSVHFAQVQMIQTLLQIPSDEREIPIQSTTKSAAKITYDISSST